MNRRYTALLAAGALALGAGGGVGAVSLASNDAGTTTVTTTTASATMSNVAASTSTQSGTLSVNQIYDRTKQGVVDIAVTATTETTGFGPGGPQSQSLQTTAEGSGFVIDARGHVVTNQHVVDGASSIEITLADGTTASATVVGEDATKDVAVLQLDGSVDRTELTPLTLADSDTAEVGAEVVAIGNAYGFSETVTKGIISALDREIAAPDEQSTITGAIQTDAAINHGNSGSPLLNASGQVIGINSQIYSESGDSSGIGFAVSSNTVKTVVDTILDDASIAEKA